MSDSERIALMLEAMKHMLYRPGPHAVIFMKELPDGERVELGEWHHAEALRLLNEATQ